MSDQINAVDGEGFSWQQAFPHNHFKKFKSKTFSFHSLNSQHCQAAAANLRDLIGGKDSFFLFLQEPYLQGGKVAEMQGLTPYYAKGTNPWAAIVSSPNTHVWFCPKILW